MIFIIIIIIGILLMLCTFIISILLVYQRKQISNQKKIETLKSDYDKILLETQLEIQEQTFQSISREIHDNISLNLTLVKLKLNTVKHKNPEDSFNSISSSIELLSTAISDLSNISRTLSSEMIKDQGLIKAVELEVNKITNLTNIFIETRLIGVPVYLPAKIELIIFRIIQECFNNILKHANAREVFLTMNYSLNYLKIKIKDTGRGFDLKVINEDENKVYTSGLCNIKRRVEMISGTFNISSYDKVGTEVQIKVPLRHE